MIEMKMRTSASTEDIIKTLRRIVPKTNRGANPIVTTNPEKTRFRVTERTGGYSRANRFTVYRTSPTSLDVTVHVGVDVFANEVKSMETLAPKLTSLVGPVVSTWLPDEHTF